MIDHELEIGQGSDGRWHVYEDWRIVASFDTEEEAEAYRDEAE